MNHKLYIEDIYIKDLDIFYNGGKDMQSLKETSY